MPPIQAPVNPVSDTVTSPRKRPARTIGLAGTNAAFLVPDHIRKKFLDGWNVHVPLTFLTDKGCLTRDRHATSSTQDLISIDSTTGRFVTTPKPLSDEGELELTFDEWHQAWRRLLELIKTFLPEEFPLWEVHHTFILNSENRSEMWPLYLAYDAEIRKRATQFSIDPSIFSIGIWNDLESRYMAKKVLSLVQSDLKQIPAHSHYNNTSRNNNPSKGSTSRSQHRSLPDSAKTGRCIFCGDPSKTHLSRNCQATSNVDGTPCHLSRHEPTGSRHSKSGKRYCYAWNGPSGCERNPCLRGEHWCTLCGSKLHAAQQCDIVA